MSSKQILLGAAISGLLFVLIGAFAAHGLKASIVSPSALDTGLRYHSIHSCVLLAIGLLNLLKPHRAWVWAAILTFIGIALFSGSLYGLALGGPRWLGPITPLGGMSLILAWCSLIYGSIKVDI